MIVSSEPSAMSESAAALWGSEVPEAVLLMAFSMAAAKHDGAMRKPVRVAGA